MPKLKVLSGNDVLKIFFLFGFEIKSQKGSHVKIFRNTILGKQTLTIPLHIELDKGTIKGIINQASLYINESELQKHFYHQ
ncbi:MAG: type II toxin-antitoxin system HicA family toxin [Candidatus Kapabacteria bacterium]|nr:type II toxin-antitoxin system HicA family toxin [Candidatus Kapabacteria bacterium]